MFNVGGGEIIVILLLALLVLGPDKLPATAKKVGRFLHEVRRMTSGFEQEVRQALDFENLGSSESRTSGGSAASSSDDAIHRMSDGPSLPAAPETDHSRANPATPASGAFVADLSAPRVPDETI